MRKTKKIAILVSAAIGIFLIALCIFNASTIISFFTAKSDELLSVQKRITVLDGQVSQVEFDDGKSFTFWKYGKDLYVTTPLASLQETGVFTPVKDAHYYYKGLKILVEEVQQSWFKLSLEPQW